MTWLGRVGAASARLRALRASTVADRKAHYPYGRPTPAILRSAPARRTLLARRHATLEASRFACTWQHQGIRCVAKAADVLTLDHTDRSLCARHIAVALRQGAQRLS